MKNHFKFTEDQKVKLSSIPVKVKHLYKTDEDYKKILTKVHDQIGDFQAKLYAEQRRSLVIIFQGMDAAGKDGAIKHVMSGVNPQGCQVTSFKEPNSHELNHDFLWRINQALPARGEIGIFNRSHYEEVLVARVHPDLLLNEKLPTGKKHDSKFWENRFRDIVHYEKYLHEQGCTVIKIFLHISKEEQKRRLLARFDDPNKMWKIAKSDLQERKFWKAYQKAYEECIGKTATSHAPWYIVPADDKENARLLIAEILVSMFERMKLAFPKLSKDEIKNLKKLKAMLR